MAGKSRKRRPGKALFVVVFAVIVGVVVFSNLDLEGIIPHSVMSFDEAAAKLDKKMRDVTWREDIARASGAVAVESSDLEDSLPPIAKYPLVVNPSSGGATAEIFVSTEKSGSGTDGWMVEAADAFNRSGEKTSGGQLAQVRIRKIASGTGYQFIASGKYRPDGYSPSNHLWVRMAEARGARMTPIAEKTVGNIAGIVMKEDAAEALEESAGSVTVPAIIDAAVQGRLAVGYTNPYASSTGLNFLVTVLMTFSNGDEGEMLSGDVVSAFEAFQKSVPFLAMTTLQMRDSVRRDGSLDAFVMEYQTYIKTEELPGGESVLCFQFSDLNEYKKWWIVCEGSSRDLCYEDPGKDVSAYISTTSHELVRIWMGDVSLSDAMSNDRITVLGDNVICKRFKKWFPLSPAAGIPRPA